MAGGQPGDYPNAGAPQFAVGGKQYKAVPIVQNQPASAPYGYQSQPQWDYQRLESALKTHSRGTMAYLMAWIAIPVGLLMLCLSMAALVSSSSLLGGSASSLPISTSALEDILLGSLGLLGAGMALRGVGFFLMMKADLVIRTYAWTSTA